MCDVKLGILGKVPDIIIKITPLDPMFPVTTEDGVELSGKK
jgi:hypothetical protein